MLYREFKPGPEARQFVKCYWVLEDDSPSNQYQTIVPDGRAELLINLRSPFQQTSNGQWHSQAEIFFVGQITGPFLVRPSGPVRTIGVRFRPEGARRLFGVPMYELTDKTVSLDDISPRLLGNLQRLKEIDSLPEQLHVLERVIVSQAQQKQSDDLIGFAVTEFERVNGLIGIGELADSLGLSSRQFERRFLSAVGIPPKLFSRMQRFQNVFQRMEDLNAKWVDAAILSGYYDQAHLIRDFREFSGTTPTALLAPEFDLTRRFF